MAETKETKTTVKLEALREEITHIEEILEISKDRLDGLYKALRENELAISEKTLALRKLDSEIAQKTITLDTLTQRQRLRTQAFEQQKSLLKAQIFNAYLVSRQDPIKLLLNQQDLSKVSRALVYHDHFVRAHTQRLTAINEQVEAIEGLAGSVLRETERLDQLRNRRQQELERLDAHRETRSRVVTRLEQQAEDQGQVLHGLRQDEQRLERLVRLLRSSVRVELHGEQLDKPFAALKGKLPWPAKGAIEKRFGSARDHGSLRWKGVVIDTPLPSEVLAISRGQVVFADWFKNLGMLIIIDHDDGYMSLYGQNQALLAGIGNEVELGDVIATSSAEQGLYFEIRHQGDPQDPAKWCWSP